MVGGGVGGNVGGGVGGRVVGGGVGGRVVGGGVGEAVEPSRSTTATVVVATGMVPALSSMLPVSSAPPVVGGLGIGAGADGDGVGQVPLEVPLVPPQPAVAPPEVGGPQFWTQHNAESTSISTKHRAARCRPRDPALCTVL